MFISIQYGFRYESLAMTKHRTLFRVVWRSWDFRNGSDGTRNGFPNSIAITPKHWLGGEHQWKQN